MDPIEDGNEIVATRLTCKHLSPGIDLADGQLLVQGTNIQHFKSSLSTSFSKKGVEQRTRHHKYLDRVNDEDIVDVETRMTVVER